MHYNNVLYHRKSIRLQAYDYSQKGGYFVTICVQNRKCLFGEIKNQTMFLNNAGSMIEKWWRKLPIKYPQISLDEYVIMPNHLHGIIHIVDAIPYNHRSTNNNIVGAIPCNRPNIALKMDENMQKTQGENILCKKGENMVSPLRLGDYISWFKRMSTNEYIRNVKEKYWEPFEKRLWHRNYYEHIIRNEHDCNRISEYIVSNPENWDKDELFNG